ncbi:MAG: hypothetical protein IKL96_06625 [Kiritimatiellae bacterium]|nr:hypothetical protein [Kiritimatiellia bacterium]
MPDAVLLPQFNIAVKHAADVVDIAIGLNLIMPVASSLLRFFLDGIEIAPERIPEKYFDGKDLTSENLTNIAVAAQEIERERQKCSPLAWKWWFIDIATASAGIWLLLSGVVDRVGIWCLGLFLPAVLATGCAAIKYARIRGRFMRAIDTAKKQAESRDKSNSVYVKAYTDRCKKALKKLKATNGSKVK